MKAYIHCTDGIPTFDFAMACYEGAQKRGMEIIKFDDIMEVPANKNNLVVACIEDTISYLERLGVDTPYALDAFAMLNGSGLIKRKYYVMKLSDIMPTEPHQTMTFFKDKPFFMKPLKNTKAFAAGVVTNYKNLPIMLSDYKGPKDIEVLVSEVVDMVSEYRVFVRTRTYNDDPITGVKHYLGDPFLVPDKQYVVDAINYLKRYTDMPHSYTLDVAILSDGRTEVIELNDAWSSGSYGLNGKDYLSFYIDRWIQLMGPKYTQPDRVNKTYNKDDKQFR